MGLIEMEPRNDLSSTGYVLANPGVEYLVLQPEPVAAFMVTLEPGTYAVEWFDVDERGTRRGGSGDQQGKRDRRASSLRSPAARASPT